MHSQSKPNSTHSASRGRPMTDVHSELPFTLPLRATTRQIRGDDNGVPTARQAMAGFESRFSDIVDYIVQITDDIWIDRRVDYILDTYAADCVVYTSNGIVRTARQVTENTYAAIAAAPDGENIHLNVAWSGDEVAGFYTAHLGYDVITNAVSSLYGTATGRRYSVRFAADCISNANKIHTEWLVRDNGGVVYQLGFDINEVAQKVAAQQVAEPYLPETSAPLPSPAPGSVEAWASALFDAIWNARNFERLGDWYAPDVAVHTGGARELNGLEELAGFAETLVASIPDGRFRVEHVCWADEADGVIVAVRWLLLGTTAHGGLLGDALPVGRPVYMMGISHLRLNGAKIVEEWTVFDEVAVRAMAWRA